MKEKPDFMAPIKFDKHDANGNLLGSGLYEIDVNPKDAKTNMQKSVLQQTHLENGSFKCKTYEVFKAAKELLEEYDIPYETNI